MGSTPEKGTERHASRKYWFNMFPFSSQYILLYFLSFLFLCFSFLFIFFSFLFVCFLLFSFFFSCSLRKYSPHTTQFPQVVSRYEQKFRQVHILAQTADSDFRFCKKVTISLHTLQLVDLRFTVIFTYIEAQQHSKISSFFSLDKLFYIYKNINLSVIASLGALFFFFYIVFSFWVTG